MIIPVDSCSQSDLGQVTSAPVQYVDDTDINFAESLLLLNDDCLLEIFSNLDLNDLSTMGSTCWRLKNVARRICNKEFDLSNQNSDLTMMNVRNTLEVLGPCFTQFKASGLTFPSSNELLLTMVAKYCQNLTALSLEEFQFPNNILRNFNLLNKLKKLHLKGGQVLERDLSILFEGSIGKRIEEITLSKLEIKGSCLSRFENLKVADLSHCRMIEPKYLISFIDQNRQLEDLNIINCKVVNLQCITAIASTLTSLKKLHLDNHYERLSSNSYLPLADLPCLVHLQIHFIRHHSADSFLLKLSDTNQLEYLDISYASMAKETHTALKKLTNLKVLKLNDLSRQSGETFKIISEMKYLEELEITSNICVTNEKLLATVKNSKQIRRMDITDCHHVTNSFILDLVNIVEGRPQILNLSVGWTRINKEIYTENLKSSKFINLDYTCGLHFHSRFAQCNLKN